MNSFDDIVSSIFTVDTNGNVAIRISNSLTEGTSMPVPFDDLLTNSMTVDSEGKPAVRVIGGGQTIDTTLFLTKDQTSPQTITGLSDGYLKLTSGVIGTGTISILPKARCTFNDCDMFSTTVSRRGRSVDAISMTTYEMTANASGSASVTIKKCSYANYPSTLTTIGTVTLISAQKATGSLAVSLSAGDYLIFELTSSSGIVDLDVELY